jgi:hypothetical protein
MTRWTGTIDGVTHLREIVKLQHASSGAPLENLFDRIVAEKKILWLPAQSMLVTPDGTTVQVIGCVSPLLDSSNMVTGMTIVLFPPTHPDYLEFSVRPKH